MPDNDTMAEWERELMSIEPACVCDWRDDDGALILECRLHPLPD